MILQNEAGRCPGCGARQDTTHPDQYYHKHSGCPVYRAKRYSCDPDWRKEWDIKPDDLIVVRQSEYRTILRVQEFADCSGTILFKNGAQCHIRYCRPAWVEETDKVEYLNESEIEWEKDPEELAYSPVVVNPPIRILAQDPVRGPLVRYQRGEENSISLIAPIPPIVPAPPPPVRDLSQEHDEAGKTREPGPQRRAENAQRHLEEIQQEVLHLQKAAKIARRLSYLRAIEDLERK